MATYTGIELIDRCLTSMLEQTFPGPDMEVVIVIDGPNPDLYERIKNYDKPFAQKNIGLIIEMFEENQGRFAAQKRSAELASGEWLIFMGDRIAVPPDYLETIFALNEEVVIPGVIEVGWEKSIINTFIHLARKRIFSRKSRDLEKIYITTENFEQTPKGSGGLLIKKQQYLEACENMNVDVTEKHVSDDTRMLRALVNNDRKLCRSQTINILYQPRNSFSQQVRHLYERGPRFVNYYIQPKTRFHNILLGFLLFPPLLLAVGIISKVSTVNIAIALAGLLLLASILLAQKPSHVYKLFLAIPVVAAVFYTGLIKGLFIHLQEKKSIAYKKYVSIVVLAISFIFFGWYILNNQKQFQLLSHIKFEFIFLLIIMNVLSLFVNGIFIKIVLSPFNKKIGIVESFYVSLISSVGNFFAPGGTGIGIRGLYLKRKHGLKYSDFLTTVAGNYVIVFFVVSVSGLTSLFLIGNYDERSNRLLFLVFGSLFIIDLILMLSKASRATKSLLLSTSRHFPGKSIVVKILDGWNLIISDRKVLPQLIMLAAFGYLVGLATNYFILESLQIEISFAGLLLLVALSSISVFLNVTPGNIGIKEAVLVASSQVTGLSTAETLSYSIIDRTVLFSVLFLSWTVLQILNARKKVDKSDLEPVS